MARHQAPTAASAGRHLRDTALWPGAWPHGPTDSRGRSDARDRRYESTPRADLPDVPGRGHHQFLWCRHHPGCSWTDASDRFASNRHRTAPAQSPPDVRLLTARRHQSAWTRRFHAAFVAHGGPPTGVRSTRRASCWDPQRSEGLAARNAQHPKAPTGQRARRSVQSSPQDGRATPGSGRPSAHQAMERVHAIETVVAQRDGRPDAHDDVDDAIGESHRCSWAECCDPV